MEYVWLSTMVKQKLKLKVLAKMSALVYFLSKLMSQLKTMLKCMNADFFALGKIELKRKEKFVYYCS